MTKVTFHPPHSHFLIDFFFTSPPRHPLFTRVDLSIVYMGGTDQLKKESNMYIIIIIVIGPTFIVIVIHSKDPPFRLPCLCCTDYTNIDDRLEPKANTSQEAGENGKSGLTHRDQRKSAVSLYRALGTGTLPIRCGRMQPAPYMFDRPSSDTKKIKNHRLSPVIFCILVPRHEQSRKHFYKYACTSRKHMFTSIQIPTSKTKERMFSSSRYHSVESVSQSNHHIYVL